jgi:hypothetical protein
MLPWAERTLFIINSSGVLGLQYNALFPSASSARGRPTPSVERYGVCAHPLVMNLEHRVDLGGCGRSSAAPRGSPGFQRPAVYSLPCGDSQAAPPRHSSPTATPPGCDTSAAPGRGGYAHESLGTHGDGLAKYAATLFKNLAPASRRPGPASAGPAPLRRDCAVPCRGRMPALRHHFTASCLNSCVSTRHGRPMMATSWVSMPHTFRGCPRKIMYGSQLTTHIMNGINYGPTVTR